MKKLFENWRMYTEEESPEAAPTEEKEKTKETLLEELEELLRTWPACDKEPDGMACSYHKDLEKVVKEYGGAGCGPGAHGEADSDQGGFVSGPAAEPIEEQ